jgi:hypothetical protein
MGHHDLLFSRPAKPRDILLYRAFDLLDGIGMKEEMAKAVLRNKNKARTSTLRRPFEDDDRVEPESSRRVRRRIERSPPRTTPPPPEIAQLYSPSPTDSPYASPPPSSYPKSTPKPKTKRSPIKSASDVRRSPRINTSLPNKKVLQRRRAVDDKEDKEDKEASDDDDDQIAIIHLYNRTLIASHQTRASNLSNQQSNTSNHHQ